MYRIYIGLISLKNAKILLNNHVYNTISYIYIYIYYNTIYYVYIWHIYLYSVIYDKKVVSSFNIGLIDLLNY